MKKSELKQLVREVLHEELESLKEEPSYNVLKEAKKANARKIVYVLSTFSGKDYVYDNFYAAVDDAENKYCTEANSVYPYYLEADGTYTEMVPDGAEGCLCWTDEEGIIEESCNYKDSLTTIMAKSLGENIKVAKKDVALARKIDRKASTIWRMGENKDEDSMCAKYGIQNWSGVELFDKFASEAGLDFDLVDDDLNEEFRLYENMWDTKPMAEAVQSADMYIVAADGDAGGSLYYIGNSKVDARKEYKSVAKDWRAFGLGGGDTPVCLYKYFGPTEVFDDIRARWESGEKFDYTINIEEFGISLDNCDVLASEWGD